MPSFIQALISFTDPQKRNEAERIYVAWSQPHCPSKTEVETAAVLAQEEYLTSVKCMKIMNMDISDIPSDQMDKLASIVIETVDIRNMTPASLVSSILASVQCPWLRLYNMELTKADTWTLVTAMRDRVLIVTLWHVPLDIEELSQYDGQGRCRKFRVWGDKRTRDRLRWWEADKRWTVLVDNGEWGLVMARK